MRHPLIPTAEKKALHHEYHVRLSIVFLWTLSVVGVIGITALFPAFMYASVEEVSALNTVSSSTKQPHAAEVSHFKTELTLSKNTANSVLAGISTSTLTISDVIASVVAVRGQNSISMIAINRTTSGKALITIEGIAPTRNMLLAFKESIQAALSDATVDLPLEQLTQVKNVKFSIKVRSSTP